MTDAIKYKRVIVKMSGEALSGNTNYGIEPKVLDRLAAEISSLLDNGVETGIVIGGGNLFRGAKLSQAGLDRTTGDYMGMLATVMNALAMRDAIERSGHETRIMSAIPMSGIVDHYNFRKAIHHLSHGRVVIFAAGTGTTLVTTDAAASLRAIEVNADLLLKATQVNGVYSSDPKKNPNAERYTHLTFDEALKKELGIMDISAFAQCRDHNMPIMVFDINNTGSLLRIAKGEHEGTLVTN